MVFGAGGGAWGTSEVTVLLAELNPLESHGQNVVTITESHRPQRGEKVGGCENLAVKSISASTMSELRARSLSVHLPLLQAPNDDLRTP